MEKNVIIRMKDELRELYKANIPKFEEIIEKLSVFRMNVSGPLLISPPPGYSKQMKKLVVIGAETNGWGHFADNIEEGMNHYDRFGLGKGQERSDFWTFCRRLESELDIDAYSAVWTNVNKFDVDGRRPFGRLLKEMLIIDDLLIHELKIIVPDIIIFLTGSNLDYRIQGIFDGAKFKSVLGFSKERLALVNHPSFKCTAIRIDDPSRLKVNGLEERVLDYLGTLPLSNKKNQKEVKFLYESNTQHNPPM